MPPPTPITTLRRHRTQPPVAVHRFAAMTTKQNMLCPWKSKRWRKFGLRRSNGAFAVDPHRARKLFISEKIVR
ncbi:hypothetical protein H6S10_26785 (plasmid) [Escherichia coli]|nr:hypothetical protein H6S10_26785 [Escherichia coli]